MYDLIIIGGGPAGLTAAIYAIRKRLNCLLISPNLGGKAIWAMDIEGIDTTSVINGADQVRRFLREVEYLDFARRLERVTDLKRVNDHFEVTTQSGQTAHRHAPSSWPPARMPCGWMCPARSTTSSRVSPTPQSAMRRFIWTSGWRWWARATWHCEGPVSWHRSLTGSLSWPPSTKSWTARWAAVCRNPSTSRCWRVGSRSPWKEIDYARQLVVRGPDGQQQTLDVDAIFVELGLKPHSELVAGWVDLDEAGRVQVTCMAETNVPGLFAAGDVTCLPAEQVLVAIGEGAKAALSAYEYLLTL